jgi:hypothetical protein
MKKKKKKSTPLAKLSEAIDRYKRLGTMRFTLDKLPQSNRRDCVLHEVQPDVCLASCWLNEYGACGPVVSVYSHGLEVLRFDCFGTGGHFHITPFALWDRAETRALFRERTAEEQIDRTMFEIMNNLDFYLSLNPKARVRNTKISRELLAKACREASDAMKRHLAKVPELEPCRATARTLQAAKDPVQQAAH